jgi:D-arabinose 1-dehydrogenase-like Zn-dependent alcohol dehydrogenase
VIDVWTTRWEAAADDMHCVNSEFPGVDATDGGMADYLCQARLLLQPADVASLADAGLTAYHAHPDAMITVSLRRWGADRARI